MGTVVERKTVGSKGEIIPSKKLRQKLELVPGAEVEISIEGQALIVKAIPDPLQELDGILDTDLSVAALKKLASLQTNKEASIKRSTR